MNRFKIGDMVMFRSAIGDPMVGRIVGWEFDEGDVWAVDYCGKIFYRWNCELTPYNGRILGLAYEAPL